MITVTGNYYTDLEAAINAGIIVKKGGKMPSKASVYAAIEEFNRQVPTEVITDEPTAEELLALDAAEDAALAAQPQARKRQKQVKGPSKLDLLRQAMAEGIEDVEELAQRSGMKPQGVKGWVGVIRSQGIDNWRQSTQKRVG